MTRIPKSLLAFRMARLEVLDHVVRSLVREQMRAAGQSADDVAARAVEVRRHFEAHPPFGIPAPEMVAAIDLFFNALAADLKVDRGTR
jgi:hypothetical protein